MLRADDISPVLDAAGRIQLSASAQSGFATGAGATPDYEAASTSYRLGQWGLSGSGPNTALGGSLPALRSRCRNLVRNNPLVAGGVDNLVANIVGTDISPRWIIDDVKLKEAIQQLWNDSQEELDAYGISDFYGLEEQVARAMPDAGEALARFRPRYASEGLLVPLQVQLLEADHLDSSFDSIAPNTGNVIRMGIEWDKLGRRAAYWLFREHPGEQYAYYNTYAAERVRVPASEMLHVFRPLRIGQARGCPWFSSVLTKIREIDQLDDAVLVRRKVANLFAMFTKTTPAAGAAPGTMPGQNPTTTDTAGRPVAPLSPGLSVRLKVGEEVIFSDPPDVGDSYMTYMKQQLRFVATGMGIMYEHLGDLEGVTFSSIRAGLNEFRRRMEILQQRILIFQFCRPVVRRWLDTAVFSGAIRIEDYLDNKRRYWRIEWQPQAWPFVSPVDDRIAEQMDIRNGLASRDSANARRGRDVETVENEIAADNQRADAKGLIFDTDPRKTARSGMIQQAETFALQSGSK